MVVECCHASQYNAATVHKLLVESNSFKYFADQQWQANACTQYQYHHYMALQSEKEVTAPGASMWI